MGRLTDGVIRSAKCDIGYDVLIETGTRTGRGAESCQELFKEIHTIELDGSFHAYATAKLSQYPHIKCHHGDSMKLLPRIIDPHKSTVFWLDAHYSATHHMDCNINPPLCSRQCPLMDELQVIMSVQWDKSPVILIDDARMFGEKFWHTPAGKLYDYKQWPRMAEIKELVERHGYTLTATRRMMTVRRYWDIQ